MYRFKQLFFAALFAAALVALFSNSPAYAQAPKAAPTQNVKVVNAPNEPVPVTGTVSVGNTVETRAGIPSGAFSVVSSGGLVSGPDPEGTSYAITSVTVANSSSTSVQALLDGVYATTSDCTNFTGASITRGPRVRVPAGETVHLSFPQPFVLSARPGEAACLLTGGAGADVTFTLVGYRLPPAAQQQQ